MKILVRKVRSAWIRFTRRLEDLSLYRRVRQINRSLVSRVPHGQAGPVVFFNASSRINRLSQNAAFSLITSWGMRTSEIPVRYLVCTAGMLHCQIGARLKSGADVPREKPDCGSCMKLSDRLFPEGLADRIRWQSPGFEKELEGLSIEKLKQYEWEGIHLGELCLPSLRWALGRHNLVDDEPTRSLMRKFLLSAGNVAQYFKEYAARVSPAAVVIFNGVSFPEAVVRHICLEKQIPVVTHEVSALPFTSFFSHDHATAYRMDIPKTFQLSAEDERILDLYLSRRFKGDFSMAGIRFWPEIKQLGKELTTRIEACKQMVVVFTNVIFDTSQIHANVLFEDMFAWLEDILQRAKRHPETLFIIRAHPDELRRNKESRETVEERVRKYCNTGCENILFIGPDDYLNSYELIQRAKFVMVYNSSIGLEASLLGKPVLCGGQSRYSHYPTVLLPDSVEAYRFTLEDFLADHDIEWSDSYLKEARRFMYFHLAYVSLDFSPFLRQQKHARGQIILKPFDMDLLQTSENALMEVLQDGILRSGSFRYPSPRDFSGI
ncbi:MAG: hypothetical protein JXA25_04590 [Anaerolineales bacterium]|nr:hypothetical protein [Anaerolineales bacterium]